MDRPVLSKRASLNLSGTHSNFLNEAFMIACENPYDSDSNPDGILNVGTAENRLCEDLLTHRLQELSSYNPKSQYYFDKRGFHEFRDTLAGFFQKKFRSPIPLDPNHIVVVNGSTSSLDMLAHVVADEGDAFLGITPCYRRIENNMAERAGVKMIPVPLSSQTQPPFRLSIEDVKSAFDAATSRGELVRGIVLINPNNPLGTMYNKSLLLELLHFAHQHHLHIVFDEVFALSVFKDADEFHSIFSLSDQIPDPSRTHVYWSFSKDFCLSGFRCGSIYSWSSEVVKGLEVLTSFHQVSAPIQLQLNSLLGDEVWLDQVYLPQNTLRLKEAHDEMVKGLEELNVAVLDNNAGFCVWANFSKFTLNPNRAFFQKVMTEAGCYFVPGDELLCSEPGWARILFSCSKAERDEFLKRLKAVAQKPQLLDGSLTEDLESKVEIEMYSSESVSQEVGLDVLLKNLSKNIRDSDWLESNTADKWVTENPELAKIWMDSKNVQN